MDVRQQHENTGAQSLLIKINKLINTEYYSTMMVAQKPLFLGVELKRQKYKK